MKYKNIELKWLGHSGFLIKFNNLNIYIDPINLGMNFYEKADLILITHGHHDHFSVEDIKKIYKRETKFIGPVEVLSQTRPIGDIDFTIAEPGKKININEIVIDCVEAYNTNKHFHSRGDGVGYIIYLNSASIYHAGDTDIISEMNNIKADILLLPVSGKFTMTALEAARAAEIIKPEIAIPIHWGVIAGLGSLEDANNFFKICQEKGINVIIPEKE